MNQRLVWNFEFNTQETTPSLEYPMAKEAEAIRWEIRFFWPHNTIICLNPAESTLLDLANYQRKERDDHYYLLPEYDYNIKKRREEILYKPLIKKVRQAVGFGSKTALEMDAESSFIQDLQLQKIAQQIEATGKVVHVKKQAFIYKFPTKPTIKLELARLEVLNQIYFSACIEGKSLGLVENIANHLLDKQVSCDYVSFLKKILPQ